MNVMFSSLLTPLPPLPCFHPMQSKGGKKTLKNLKRVLTAAAGMADSLKTVGSVFSDKRVLFINSVPFLSIFSFALYFAVPFGKAGYFHILRGHICWLFLFLLCGITQKSVRAGFKISKDKLTANHVLTG